MAQKPGAPPPGTGGVPSDFEYLTDERLPTNPGITRMPTNQREWSAFVRELDKRIKNISDGFAPTFSGFSSDPSNPFIWYHRYGQLVMMEFHIGLGTSNNSIFYVNNLPEIITPKYDVHVPYYNSVNNGTQATGPANAEIKANGTIRFWPDTTGSGWTSSGNKGISASAGDKMAMTYWLRNPSKL